ncbi:MAG: hypothetical protein AAF799_24720 [Myxococcota bacterium]
MSRSTIADDALDLVDGLHELVDVAFGHDLAVAFADLGSHESALIVTDGIIETMISIHEELPKIHSLGHLGGLVASLEPLVVTWIDLLLEAANVFNPAAMFDVTRVRRVVDLALAHQLAAGRLGLQTPLGNTKRTVLRFATDALLVNLHSMHELLRALDPVELPPLELPAAPK